MKKTNDLLVVRSDAYRLADDWTLAPASSRRGEPPLVGSTPTTTSCWATSRSASPPARPRSPLRAALGRGRRALRPRRDGARLGDAERAHGRSRTGRCSRGGEADLTRIRRRSHPESRSRRSATTRSSRAPQSTMSRAESALTSTSRPARPQIRSGRRGPDTRSAPRLPATTSARRVPVTAGELPQYDDRRPPARAEHARRRTGRPGAEVADEHVAAAVTVAGMEVRRARLEGHEAARQPRSPARASRRRRARRSDPGAAHERRGAPPDVAHVDVRQRPGGERLEQRRVGLERDEAAIRRDRRRTGQRAGGWPSGRWRG